MKKNASLIRISTFAVLLLLLVGCHSDDENFIPIPNPDAPITFQISIMNRGDAARAATDATFETTWQEGDAIGLYAVRYIDGVPTPLLPGGNYIDNAKLTLNADGTWTGDAYYPLLSKSTSSDKYAFYAYYPYVAGLVDPTNISINTLAKPVDHLTATVKGIDHGAPVSLNFVHKVAMVQLNFDDTKCYASPALSVKLRGCTPTGALNLSTGIITANGSLADVPMTRFDANTYRAWVPAQTIAENTSMFLIDEKDQFQSEPLDAPLALTIRQPKEFEQIIEYDDYAPFIVDEVFRTFCIDEFDVDKDGRLSYAEVMEVEMINMYHSAQVRTLMGVEHFRNLMILICTVNSLTELSLSDLPKLSRLNCSGGSITTLSLFNLPQLTTLYCYYNDLKVLSLSNLPQLASLNCYDNDLAVLSLFNLPQLTNLECGCNRFSMLSISDLPRLTSLDCRDGNIATLSLSDLPELASLNCSNNQIITLSLSSLPKLINLECNNNNLTELSSLSNLPKLVKLDCRNNNLTELPQLSSLTQLMKLDCRNNNLAELPQLSSLTQLTDMNCGSNRLTELPSLSALTQLRTLYCNNNLLTKLPFLSDLVRLVALGCYLNPISELDISANVALSSLYCGNWDESTNTGTQLTIYVALNKELGRDWGELDVQATCIDYYSGGYFTPVTTKGTPVYGVTVLDKP